MGRDLPTAVATAIVGSVVKYAFFAQFEFASGTVRLWSGAGSKSWNSSSWSGAGDFGGITPVDESTDVSASGLAFRLSGIPGTSLALALGENYRGKPCKLWLAILDDDDDVVDAYQVFAGRMDVMKIDDGGDAGTISVQAENCLVDLQRPRLLRYTDAEQQRLFPGDLGLQFVAKLAERPLYWGVASAAMAPVYSGGGDNGETQPD